MKYYKKQIIQILAFLLISEAFTITLLIIVPKGKIFVASIALFFLIICVRSLWRMSPNQISYIDYDQQLLCFPRKNELIEIQLKDITRDKWQYKYVRQDKKVSYLDLLKIINSGLFLLNNSKALPFISKIDKNDYEYLINHHNAPIAVISIWKEAKIVLLGENTISLYKNEIHIQGFTSYLLFPDINIQKGIFKKRITNEIPLTRWGGTFRIGKNEYSYEYIRPYAFL